MLRPRRPLLPSNNLPSPATLFRCSFIAPPSSRVQDPGDDDVLGTIPVELARGMGNEIANTVPVYVSPVYIGRPCCLRSFRLFRLVCRPPIVSRDSIVYMRWIGVSSFWRLRWGSILLKKTLSKHSKIEYILEFFSRRWIEYIRLRHHDFFQSEKIFIPVPFRLC